MNVVITSFFTILNFCLDLYFLLDILISLQDPRFIAVTEMITTVAPTGQVM